LIVPSLVVAEVSYLIGTNLGPAAELDFFRMLQHRRFRIEPVTGDDLVRITELVERYADLPLGGTDASVVAAAERLGFDTIATLDHRHFKVVRPAHVDAFTLVP
jgi:hypothetical protein